MFGQLRPTHVLEAGGVCVRRDRLSNQQLYSCNHLFIAGYTQIVPFLLLFVCVLPGSAPGTRPRWTTTTITQSRVAIHRRPDPNNTQRALKGRLDHPSK
jgi:hypothetical protein